MQNSYSALLKLYFAKTLLSEKKKDHFRAVLKSKIIRFDIDFFLRALIIFQKLQQRQKFTAYINLTKIIDYLISIRKWIHNIVGSLKKNIKHTSSISYNQF